MSGRALRKWFPGIPMRDLLAGCVVGLLQDTPALDLTSLEEQSSRGPQLFTAMHCTLDKVCGIAVGSLPCPAIATAPSACF